VAAVSLAVEGLYRGWSLVRMVTGPNPNLEIIKSYRCIYLLKAQM